MRGKHIVFIGVALALFLTQAWAAETTFPARPISVWVGFPPGGPVDIFARAIAPGAEKILGKPIVIENKPGAGGALALGLLKNAKPDGHTLAALADTPLTRTPHLMNVKYDALKDFISIIRPSLERSTVCVRSDSPFKKFQDVIEFARKNPGQLTIGVSGHGTAPHIGLAKVAQIENIKVQFVFLAGGAATITSLLGGHIMVGNIGPAAWLSHYKAGTVRPLMAWEKDSMDEVPDLPSQEKLGYNLPICVANMIVAPKGLPKPVEDKLVTAFVEGTKTPQFLNVARQQQQVTGKPMVGDELKKWVESTYAVYAKIIGELGIKAEAGN